VYTEDAITDSSTLWIETLKNEKAESSRVLMLQKNNLSSVDSFLSPEADDDRSFFTIIEDANDGPVVGEIKEDLLAQFAVVMHEDVVYKSRTVYSILDFLGDIGGLSDALQYIGQILIWLLQGSGLMTFLVRNLFKKETIE